MKMPGNMQAMMQQAQKMQQKMQEEIALIRVEGSAGGGMVTIKMDGHKNITGVKIDPEVAGDVEMLQDWCRPPATKPPRKWKKKPEENGRHAGRPGPASGFALDSHARLRRALTAPDRRIPPPARHRAEVRAEAGVPRAAFPRDDAARLATALLDVKDNLASAPSATTSAIRNCAPTAAIPPRPFPDLRGRGAAQHPAV